MPLTPVEAPEHERGTPTRPAAAASLNTQASLMKPMAGMELNTFCSPAVSVQISSHRLGNSAFQHPPGEQLQHERKPPRDLQIGYWRLVGLSFIFGRRLSREDGRRYDVAPCWMARWIGASLLRDR